MGWKTFLIGGVRLTAILACGLLVTSGCRGPGPSDRTSSVPTVLVTTPTTTTTTTATTATTTTTATTATTTTTTTLPIAALKLSVVEVDQGFDHPVLLVADPAGGVDFVVEQSGSIVRADGQRHAVALDISDDVVFGGEQGLLGLAFHPDFATNGLAYVSYVSSGPRSVIEQFSVVDGVFEPESRTSILTVDQPARNHNGGMIAFGPDGLLWLGFGDGGGANDRYDNGQRPDTLLGSMLRIAVGEPGIDTYAVPSDNPFVTDERGAREVWAFGLRNPWRFAFDGDALWIADVGQGSVEEVNVIGSSTPGANYGWPIMEGSACVGSSDCNKDLFVLPIAEYTHADGCSVIGGVVYRGDAIPSLSGQFFYADYCSGILRSVDAQGKGFDWTAMVGAIERPTGFGVGGDGELYIVTGTGRLLKLVEGT